MSRINRILSIVFVVSLSLLLAAALPAGAQDPAPMPQDITWNGMWGSAGNDVYIVGSDGPGSEVIMHYDGAGWSLMSSMTASWLEGVGVRPPTTRGWSLVPSRRLRRRPRGQILHYDGQGWSAMRSGEYENTLKGIWGSGPGDVYAVGEMGTILHYDGSKWSPMESDWEVKPNPMPTGPTWGTTPFSRTFGVPTRNPRARVTSSPSAISARSCTTTARRGRR